jgi:ATP-dependent Lon protease
LPRDVALTGELSISGGVRPVGGIVEKLYAARQAGMRMVLVPRENARDVDRSIGGIEIVTVANVRDALDALGIGVPARPPARRARRVAR